MSLDLQKQEQKNKIIDKLYSDIKINSKEQVVSNGDSIYAIAKENSMNVDDLLLLNSIIGKEFIVRWKNVLIKAWDIVYIPKNIDIFNNNLSKLKEIKEILNINQELTKWELSSMKLEMNLYPTRVQSIGLPKILGGFIASQEAEYNPELPRIVDSGRETHVSCANLIRTLMAQSVNIADLKPGEKEFLKKQNLDAWILPTELEKIWYGQRFADLMTLFDQDKIGQVDPISNQKAYDKRVLELNNYIEKNWVPGSLVPYYFKFSKYKWVVADYNRRRKEDKHLNTHQSMFAWNADMKFDAYEVKDYSIPGKITNFGGDKEKINKEIKDLSSELEIAKSDLIKTKSLLLKSVDLSENAEIKKVDKQLTKWLSVATGGNEMKIEQLKAVIIASWNENLVKSQAEKVLKRKISDADVERLLALRKIYFATYNSVLSVNQNLSKNAQVQEVKGNLKSNSSILANINKYNDALETIKNNEASIKDLKEKLKIERKLTLVDYIANFIQDRLDYGPVAFTPESRAKIIEWILKYNSMIHIKVNGQKILLDREARNYQKWLSTIFVKPDTKIEISGPMMIDGEHQLNSADPDRQKKMNARTRFFFEFITPWTYLATELIEPGKVSSFRKTEFGKPSDKFEVKWVYDLRRWETVEKALKEKIIIFEKLNPKDPKFTQKLNYIYWIQIKALKIAGFMQDEQVLNPWAFKINRTIPYYDLKNIEKEFSSYIINKKKVLWETGEKLKGIKEFASVNIFPWDTEYHVFNRLKSSLEWTVDNQKYPHIKNIFSINYLQQKNLIKQLLDWFYDKNWHIISWKKLVISFAKLDKILEDISRESFVSSPKLKNIDNFVIDKVTWIKGNQNLIKNILHNEIYTNDSNNSIISRKFVKQKLEGSNMISSIWDFQIRINFLKSWWNEWLNKDTMNKVFEVLNDKSIRKQIYYFSEYEQLDIEKDLKEMSKLKTLVNKNKLSKDDFSKIYEILRSVIRIDSWDNSNYVWKVISRVFMESKLNNHSEKLAWMMTYSWENIDEIYSNPKKMKDYERVVILINNQWERNSFYAMTENYILRIINKWLWINIQTEDVYDDSLKWKALWKIDYNKEVFMEHLKSYIDQLNVSKLNMEQEHMKNILERFYIDLDESKWQQQFMNTIYSFMKNQSVNKFLQEKNLSSSILPEENEYTASEFQKSAFNYVIKWLNT